MDVVSYELIRNLKTFITFKPIHSEISFLSGFVLKNYFCEMKMQGFCISRGNIEKSFNSWSPLTLQMGVNQCNSASIKTCLHIQA